MASRNLGTVREERDRLAQQGGLAELLAGQGSGSGDGGGGGGSTGDQR